MRKHWGERGFCKAGVESADGLKAGKKSDVDNLLMLGVKQWKAWSQHMLTRDVSLEPRNKKKLERMGHTRQSAGRETSPSDLFFALM